MSLDSELQPQKHECGRIVAVSDCYKGVDNNHQQNEKMRRIKVLTPRSSLSFLPLPFNGSVRQIVFAAVSCQS